MKPMLTKIGEEESWHLKADCAEAAMTRSGGHLGYRPLRRSMRRAIGHAPWINERLASSIPTVARLLRRDFSCMTSRSKHTLYHGEAHPVHGETANAVGLRILVSVPFARVLMRTPIREGRVDEIIQLERVETTVYLQHVISG
jgi:hypothetical protein